MIYSRWVLVLESDTPRCPRPEVFCSVCSADSFISFTGRPIALILLEKRPKGPVTFPRQVTRILQGASLNQNEHINLFPPNNLSFELYNFINQIGVLKQHLINSIIGTDYTFNDFHYSRKNSDHSIWFWNYGRWVSSFTQNFQIMLKVGCGFMGGGGTERSPEGRLGGNFARKPFPVCVRGAGDPCLAAIGVCRSFLLMGCPHIWSKTRLWRVRKHVGAL